MQHDHILKKNIEFYFYMGGFLAPGAEFEKKIHLSGALAALLFSRVKLFVQFWLRALVETIL